MAGDTPLVRQWLLIKTLSARHFGATVQSLARELRVTDKTIRRDLATILAVGFPLEETIGGHGQKTWRISPGGNSPELHFSFDEALALYLGRRFLEPLAGTYLWEAAQNAFKKVRACLQKSALDYLDKMAASLHQTTVGAGDYSQKAAIVDHLVRSIEERKATHLTYQSQQSTEPVTYEVFPYGLVYHRGSLYLVAFSRHHKEVRHFKVNRIEEAEVSQFPFHMPDNFKLADHLAKSFGVFQGRGDVKVVVRFLPNVARYVMESNWHVSQKLTRQKDGSVLAEFRLSDTEEIKHWIMSFGKSAVVQEPPSLQQEMAKELHAMLQSYGTDGRARGTDSIRSPPTAPPGKRLVSTIKQSHRRGGNI